MSWLGDGTQECEVSALAGMLSEPLNQFLAKHSVPADPNVVFDYVLEGPFVASGALSTGAVSIWFKPKG
jgi:hypothetical protein